MNFHKTIVLILSALSGTCFCAAQKTCHLKINGIIIDAATKEQLSYAGIWCDEIDRGTTSENNGKFDLKNLCEGEYHIDIHFVGYEELRVAIKLTADTTIVFRMNKDLQFLNNVDVESKPLETPISQEELTLTDKGLERTNGKSLGEALKNISGVNTLQTGPSIAKPVIHGMHSNRILILNNGIRQEGQQWGKEHAPEIDPLVAGKLSVVKGVSAVQYGAGAVGGVVLVEPPDLSYREPLKGSVVTVVNSNSRGAMLSGSLEGGISGNHHLGWRIQGTGKRNGDFHSGNYNLTNTGQKAYGFSAVMGYNGKVRGAELYFSRYYSETGLLKGSQIGNLNDLQLAIGREEPFFTNDFNYQINNPRQVASHNLLKVKAYQKNADLGTLSITYGWQFNKRQEFDTRRGGRSEKPSIDVQSNNHSLDFLLDHKRLFNNQLIGKAGVSLSRKINDNVPGTGVNPLIPAYRSNNLGVFIVERLFLGDLGLEAGIRYDHKFIKVLTFDAEDNFITPSYHFNSTSVNLGVNYKVLRKVTVSSNIGFTQRRPDINELFSNGLHHGTASIEEGILVGSAELSADFDEKNIAPENAVKWFSTLHYHTNRWKSQVSFHYSYINNFITLEPRDVRLTIRGAFPVFSYEQVSASFAGLDIDFEVEILRNTKWINRSSFLSARDLSRNSYLVNIPSGRTYNALEYSLSKWAMLRDISFSVGLSHVFKKKNSPRLITISQLLDKTPDEVDELRDQGAFDYLEVPRSYYLVNSSLDFNLPLKTATLRFGLSIENLFNVSYREYMNRLRYFSDDTGRNFSLRIRYIFGQNK